MPKTIHSKRNPLKNNEIHIYRANLLVAICVREIIKELVPTAKYNRVFTEAQANGVCRMKLYNIKNVKSIPQILNILCGIQGVIKAEKVDDYKGIKSVVFKVSI